MFAFYRFTVFPEITSLDARLDNPSGNPVMVLSGGDAPPYPGAGGSGTPEDKYGNEGGPPLVSPSAPGRSPC